MKVLSDKVNKFSDNYSRAPILRFLRKKPEAILKVVSFVLFNVEQ